MALTPWFLQRVKGNHPPTTQPYLAFCGFQATPKESHCAVLGRSDSPKTHHGSGRLVCWRRALERELQGRAHPIRRTNESHDQRSLTWGIAYFSLWNYSKSKCRRFSTPASPGRNYKSHPPPPTPVCRFLGIYIYILYDGFIGVLGNADPGLIDPSDYYGLCSPGFTSTLGGQSKMSLPLVGGVSLKEM